MIKYALKCRDGHMFESWFASADAYDSLSAGGHIACALCGVGDVEKAIMAPRVTTARTKAEESVPAPATPQAPLTAEPSQLEAALTQMRKDVEQNATYVGGDFAQQARDMHSGDAPDRPIWGEANAAEAKALIKEGVPVAPLPFIPTRKAN